MGGSEMVQAKERSLSKGRAVEAETESAGQARDPTWQPHSPGSASPPQPHHLLSYPAFQMGKQRHGEANRTAEAHMAGSSLAGVWYQGLCPTAYASGQWPPPH